MRYYHPYFNSHNKKKRHWLKKILKLTGYFILSVIIIIVVVSIYLAKDLPDPGKISERQITQSTKIYDRTGQVLLYDIHGEEKRTIVASDQISKYLKDATVAIEDANFYHHFGLDFKGILRALWANIRGNQVSQGGSTITQQFIKNSFLTPERTYSRKIKEAILSLELEAKYSKEEILGFYLNQIPFGSNAYGAEAAAQTFFNKSIRDLTLAESALLAALPQAPSYYSPYGSHPEAMKARQEKVLNRMAELGYVLKDEAEAAKKEKLNFTKNTQTIKAPHFVMYIKEYLEEKYGQDMVEQGGLKVYTTLDWDLQQAAQQIVEEGAKNNEKKYGAYNAALAAVDPKTGQILVMVGSKDYFAESLPQDCDTGKNCRFEPNVNVTIRDRQPGSSFKPFAYALAFKKGFSPETILFDLKTEFNSSCPPEAESEEYNGNKCYHPNNYDERFRGPVNIRQALAQSLNIPSVKVLYLADVNQTIDLAQSLGITTLNERSRYGLALVLGGGEVKLLDEVAAYGVFATEGKKYEKTAILKIENAQGKILEEFQSKPIEVLEPQVAKLISDVLSDNQARTPVFGSTSPLYLADRPAAVKTGTTQEYRDAWTIGYTPSLVAGVWTGNNDNAPMSRAGAGMAAAGPLWNAFMKKAYQIAADRQPSTGNSFILSGQPEEFNKPEPVTGNKSVLNGQLFSENKLKIDRISGKIATNLTPPELIEEKIFQEIHTILYYVNKDEPFGDPPQNPSSDPQFLNWETSIRKWAQTSGWIPQIPPSQYDDIHTLENQPIVSVVSPVQGAILNQKTFTISAQAQVKLGIKQIDFFFDDDLIGVKTKEPYTLLFTLPNQLIGTQHTIKARAYDQVFNRQEAVIQIDVSFVPGLIIIPEIQPEQSTSTDSSI